MEGSCAGTTDGDTICTLLQLKFWEHPCASADRFSEGVGSDLPRERGLCSGRYGGNHRHIVVCKRYYAASVFCDLSLYDMVAIGVTVRAGEHQLALMGHRVISRCSLQRSYH